MLIGKANQSSVTAVPAAALSTLLLLLFSHFGSKAYASGADLATWDALVPGGQTYDRKPDQTPMPHGPGQSSAPLASADPFDPLGDGRLVVEEWDDQAYRAALSDLSKLIVSALLACIPSRLWFRGWWAIAQRTVGSLRGVVLSPLFDQYLCFAQALEDFAIKQFISHPPVEAFAISVLPG